MTGKDLQAFFSEIELLCAILCRDKYTLLHYTSVYSFRLHFIADVSQMFTIVTKFMKIWVESGMRSAP